MLLELEEALEMFRLLQHLNSICRYQLQVAAYPRGKAGFNGPNDPTEAEHVLDSAWRLEGLETL